MTTKYLGILLGRNQNIGNVSNIGEKAKIKKTKNKGGTMAFLNAIQSVEPAVVYSWKFTLAS